VRRFAPYEKKESENRGARSFLPLAEQGQGIEKYLYFMYIYLIILTMRPLRRGFFHGFFKKKL